MNLHALLYKKFGFNEFRAGQEEVIRDVLASKDILAIFPTGMGKSLCYQLPASVIPGTILIISPLVALMEDQVALMKKSGEKNVVALNSFQSYAERQRILSKLKDYKFIFISPELLVQKNISSLLSSLSLGLIVVDEAHCISQWGFDFRPDYLRIGEFFETINRPAILALTATADEKVISDISHYLQLHSPKVHRQPTNRQNISYSMVEMDSQHSKTTWIKDRLQTTTGPGIVYVASRRRADELASLVDVEGLSVASYHAGMEQEDRAFIQEQFLSGEVDWICATNAFGMGIHKDNIRQVIHDHIPQSASSYSQEVGRAGRDNKRAQATLLYSPDDEGKMRFITQEEFPQELEINQYWTHISTGTQKEEAAESVGLSETARRVIDYYLERMSCADVISRVDDLRTEKEKQLQKMLRLVQCETCIRQELLSYFGETLSEKQEICCSVCGLDDEYWQKKTNTTPLLSTELDWEARLVKLLGEI